MCEDVRYYLCLIGRFLLNSLRCLVAEIIFNKNEGESPLSNRQVCVCVIVTTVYRLELATRCWQSWLPIAATDFTPPKLLVGSTGSVPPTLLSLVSPVAWFHRSRYNVLRLE